MPIIPRPRRRPQDDTETEKTQPDREQTKTLRQYLTVAGAALGNPAIAVDVVDRGGDARLGGRYAFRCRACGETSSSGADTYACERAEQHAAACRALPHSPPTHEPQATAVNHDWQLLVVGLPAGLLVLVILAGLAQWLT
jgi:hypothetical protein